MSLSMLAMFPLAVHSLKLPENHLSVTLYLPCVVSQLYTFLSLLALSTLHTVCTESAVFYSIVLFQIKHCCFALLGNDNNIPQPFIGVFLTLITLEIII